MKDNLSEIVCVIDRSGSMASIASDAIGGFNNFLEEQKEVDGEARLTLVLFDDRYELVHDSVEVGDVWPLDKLTYSPRGTTALMDAVGRAIDDVGQNISDMDEGDRPSTVIFAILTDGFENASVKYSMREISEMIHHQQDKYDWKFIFLAANQDAIASASNIGIDAKYASSFGATGQGVREGTQTMSHMTTSFRTEPE